MVTNEELIAALRETIGYVRTYAYGESGSVDAKHVLEQARALLARADEPQAEPTAPDAAPEPGHSTEDDYRHFLSYSGLSHDAWYRYAYFHGANVLCDKPTSPQPIKVAYLNNVFETVSLELLPATPQHAAVPNGWKLVPIVPTSLMAVAMINKLDEYDGFGGAMEDVWNAALIAAPEPPKMPADRIEALLADRQQGEKG